MARFDYLEPHSLDEALGMLEEHGDRARLVAGSTDFLVRWRTGFWRPEAVVCMQHVPDLDGLHFNDDDGLSIGAMVTVQDIEQSATVRTRYPRWLPAPPLLPGFRCAISPPLSAMFATLRRLGTPCPHCWPTTPSVASLVPAANAGCR